MVGGWKLISSHSTSFQRGKSHRNTISVCKPNWKKYVKHQIPLLTEIPLISFGFVPFYSGAPNCGCNGWCAEDMESSTCTGRPSVVSLILFPVCAAAVGARGVWEAVSLPEQHKEHRTPVGFSSVKFSWVLLFWSPTGAVGIPDLQLQLLRQDFLKTCGSVSALSPCV